MYVFVDSEFTSLDPIHRELISIGLITENGQTFYAELPFDLRHASSFVQDVVVPLLNPASLVWPSSFEQVAIKLQAWLAAFEEPLVLVYDYDYDRAAVDALLGKARTLLLSGYFDCGIWLGESVFAAARDRYFDPLEPGRQQHHALADAKALRAGFMALRAAGMVMPGEPAMPEQFRATLHRALVALPLDAQEELLHFYEVRNETDKAPHHIDGGRDALYYVLCDLDPLFRNLPRKYVPEAIEMVLLSLVDVRIALDAPDPALEKKLAGHTLAWTRYVGYFNTRGAKG